MKEYSTRCIAEDGIRKEVVPESIKIKNISQVRVLLNQQVNYSHEQ